MAEEAREPKRLETVVGPRVRERRVLVEQLVEAIRPADGRSFEDIELGVAGQELVRPSLISSVDGLKELGHGLANRAALRWPHSGGLPLGLRLLLAASDPRVRELD